ncbi:major facilitator superfamily domain-containing protein [Syncephalis plumigaleata]|nr:major facilitator superfamily domain-containing protein [Syncephalis plumigaleata]
MSTSTSSSSSGSGSNNQSVSCVSGNAVYPDSLVNDEHHTVTINHNRQDKTGHCIASSIDVCEEEQWRLKKNEQIPLGRSLIIFLGLSLAVFLCSLDQTVIATAIPRIASDFNSLGDVSWMVGLLLTTAAVTPLYGKLAQVFGMKRVFLFALFMFLGGSLGCALSTSMVMLISFRAFAGIGGESMYALALLIITAMFTPERSAILQGWIGSVFIISAAFGPLLGGVFTDHITWRWAFYINLPVAVAFGFRDSTKHDQIRERLKRIDYLGAILLLITVSSALLALGWGGNQFSWDSPVIIVLLCVATLVGCLFIWVEGWYANEPFIPGSILRSPSVALTMMASFMSGWIVFTLVYYLPLFYQLVRSKTAMQAGILLIPLMIASCISTALTTMGIGRLGAWSFPTTLASGFFIVATTLGLLLTVWEYGHIASEMAILVLGGMGGGMLIQSAFLAAQATCSGKDIAVATMLCSFFQVIGATIGLAVSGSVFDNAVKNYVPELKFSTGGDGVSGSLEDINNLPHDTRIIAIHGIAKSFHMLFISLIPFAIVAGIGSCFIRPRRWSDVQKDANVASAH